MRGGRGGGIIWISYFLGMLGSGRLVLVLVLVLFPCAFKRRNGLHGFTTGRCDCQEGPLFNGRPPAMICAKHVCQPRS